MTYVKELNEKIKSFRLDKKEFKFKKLYTSYLLLLKDTFDQKIGRLEKEMGEAEELEGRGNRKKYLKEQIKEIKKDLKLKHINLKSITTLQIVESHEKPVPDFEDTQYVISFEILDSEYTLGIFESGRKLKLDIERKVSDGWTLEGQIVEIEDLNEETIKNNLRDFLEDIIKKQVI